jgi:hypothetical protein
LKIIGHRELPQINLREPLRDYETASCSPLALTVSEQILKELAVLTGFGSIIYV